MLSRMTHQRIVAIDFLVIAWLLVCVLVGVWAAKRINHLGTLGDGLIDAGQSISGVGDWVGGLDEIPLIGGGFGAIADRIDGLANSAVQKGEQGKEAVWRAALGVGIFLSVLPTLPILIFWIPARVSIERERNSLRAALRAREPGVWEYLARQAADDMSFRELRAKSDDPWEDIRQGPLRSACTGRDRPSRVHAGRR